MMGRTDTSQFRCGMRLRNRQNPNRTRSRRRPSPWAQPAAPSPVADPRHATHSFPAVHFVRFGRPVPVDPPSASCHMAWPARSNSSVSHTNDYRRFVVVAYYSGANARNLRPDASNGTTAAAVLRAQFAAVAYHGSFDRCKPMPHYTRNLLCILTETHYLNDH